MEDVVVLVIPQWQGSSSVNASRLVDGAHALERLTPPNRRIYAEIAATTGATKNGVKNSDVLVENLRAVRSVLSNAQANAIVVIGGDCGVELAPVESSHSRFGRQLTLVWFDAHGDLNTPKSSTSGAFNGMVLRAILGECPGELNSRRPLDPSQVVLAGVRAFDLEEQTFITNRSIQHVLVSELDETSKLVDAVARTGAQAIYIHIDLDVLDGLDLAVVGSPEEGGLTVHQLTCALAALAQHFQIIGVGITEYQPENQEEESLLAPLVLAISGAVVVSMQNSDNK